MFNAAQISSAIYYVLHTCHRDTYFLRSSSCPSFLHNNTNIEIENIDLLKTNVFQPFCLSVVQGE